MTEITQAAPVEVSGELGGPSGPSVTQNVTVAGPGAAGNESAKLAETAKANAPLAGLFGLIVVGALIYLFVSRNKKS